MLKHLNIQRNDVLIAFFGDPESFGADTDDDFTISDILFGLRPVLAGDFWIFLNFWRAGRKFDFLAFANQSFQFFFLFWLRVNDFVIWLCINWVIIKENAIDVKLAIFDLPFESVNRRVA